MATEQMERIKPVSRATLAEQVALQILEMISEGHWKEGQRLPGEVELCKSLHVGRSTLREALTSLAFVGLVQMRAGDGTFVANNSDRFLNQVFRHGLLLNKDVMELAEARIVLETELSALCAQRGTEQDLRDLEGIVSKMKQFSQLEREELLQLDIDFHLAIAKGSQNRVLSGSLRTIRGLLKAYIIKALHVPGAAELAYEQHLNILKALTKREPEKARTAMRSHLESFQRGYSILARAAESVSAVAEVSHHEPSEYRR
jgi:GntR family transcriptional repressor for pyruvate dehydrogenase complex